MKQNKSRNLVEFESNCDFEDQNEEAKSMSTKRKLLCLLSIALLAFCSIILISQQLISRHLSRTHSTSTSLTILTLEEWAQNAQIGQNSMKQGGLLRHSSGLEIAQNGIFWAPNLEARVYEGPNDALVQMQMQELRQRSVASINHPDWLHCGREKNRFVQFVDGTHACARFRADHAEFVQGEVMAFYLARILGISNTPAVVLSKVNSNQWKSVNEAEWKDGSIVALIQWIPQLTKTTMPSALRQRLVSRMLQEPLDVTSAALTQMDESQLEELVQWSDMVVFDYLTGNYDRVASMQDASEKEDKPSILKETIHNLGLSEETDSLWFLDNESAFLDAYSLIYDGTDNGVKFQRFHTDMLQTLCIFKQKTVNRLFSLKNSADPATLLLEFINANEPLWNELPRIHANSVFRQHFKDRIQQVWNWIQTCQLRVNYKPLK